MGRKAGVVAVEFGVSHARMLALCPNVQRLSASWLSAASGCSFSSWLLFQAVTDRNSRLLTLPVLHSELCRDVAVPPAQVRKERRITPMAPVSRPPVLQLNMTR
jgi:hypothetical protein